MLRNALRLVTVLTLAVNASATPKAPASIPRVVNKAAPAFPGSLLSKDTSKLTAAELDRLATWASDKAQDCYDELNRRAEKKQVATGPKPLSAETIYRKVAPAVVAIKAEGLTSSSGTGFLYGAGEVITNFHVVAGASKVVVEMADGKQVPVGKVLWADREADLVRLRLEGQWRGPNGPLHPDLGPELFSIGMAPSDVPVGSQIYAVGNPLGLERTIASGLLSGTRDYHGFLKLYQISVPVSPGSSGSPVVDRFGRLIGVVTSTATEGQNVNFCVPIAYLGSRAEAVGMDLSTWANYSRGLTFEKLPVADPGLYSRLRGHKNQEEIWRLRSMPRLTIQVLDTSEHRQTMVKMISKQISATLPGMQLVDASEDFSQPLGNIDFATRPRATLRLFVNTFPLPSGEVGISYSLALTRQACLLSDGLRQDQPFVDRAAIDADVWTQYGRLLGPEEETRHKIDLEIKDHINQLAEWLVLANPSQGDAPALPR